MALAKIVLFLAKANLTFIPFPPAEAGGNSKQKPNHLFYLFCCINVYLGFFESGAGCGQCYFARFTGSLNNNLS